jgi:hypothetical protein
VGAEGTPGETFEREHGCTEEEWLHNLRGAAGTHALTLLPPGRACVQVGAGQLHLQWHVLAPRRIALVRIPRLAVNYRFDDVEHRQRAEFMRYFDLYMHRGGG